MGGKIYGREDWARQKKIKKKKVPAREKKGGNLWGISIRII